MLSRGQFMGIFFIMPTNFFMFANDAPLGDLL